jgi:hypothetical protein
VWPLNIQIRGTIVTPASNSCHHIGNAIDMNVIHKGKLYNSIKLKRNNLNGLTDAVQKFIAKIRADTKLRWGGDFEGEEPRAHRR